MPTELRHKNKQQSDISVTNHPRLVYPGGGGGDFPMTLHGVGIVFSWNYTFWSATFLARRHLLGLNAKKIPSYCVGGLDRPGMKSFLKMSSQASVLLMSL